MQLTVIKRQQAAFSCSRFISIQIRPFISCSNPLSHVSTFFWRIVFFPNPTVFARVSQIHSAVLHAATVWRCWVANKLEHLWHSIDQVKQQN